MPWDDRWGTVLCNYPYYPWKHSYSKASTIEVFLKIYIWVILESSALKCLQHRFVQKVIAIHRAIRLVKFSPIFHSPFNFLTNIKVAPLTLTFLNFQEQIYKIIDAFLNQFLRIFLRSIYITSNFLESTWNFSVIWTFCIGFFLSYL